MKSDDHQPATTVRELGISLDGFKELMTERIDVMNQRIENLATTVKESTSDKANKQDLIDLTLRVASIELREKKYVTTTQLWGSVVGTGTVIAVVVSLWNLIDKIRG